jgi:TP901 family phage tail tape measure protein
MKLADLIVEVTGRTTQYDRVIRGVQRSLTSTAALARTTVLGVAGAATGLVTSGIRTAIELESQFSKVRKTTGLTGDELEQLKDKLKDMSISIAGSSLSDLNEIAAIAGRLGITGVDNLASFTAAIAKVHIAMDDIPAEEAAERIARILHVFKLGTGDALRFASAVNKLDDTSTASGRHILDLTRRLSGPANNLGLTADQTAALSATLLDAGINAEVAGTAFTTVFKKMQKDPETFAKVARKSATEFAKTMEKNPIQALKQVALGLRRLNGAGQINALDAMGLKATRSSAAFQQFASTVDTLDGNLANASREMRTMASIEREVGIQAQTTKAQLEVFNNRVTILADNVGRRALPSINELLGGLGKVGDSLGILSRSDYGRRFAENFSSLFSGVGLDNFWDKIAFGLRNFDLGWQLIANSVMESFDQFTTVAGFWFEFLGAKLIWLKDAIAAAFTGGDMPTFKAPQRPTLPNREGVRNQIAGEFLNREQQARRGGSFDSPNTTGKMLGGPGNDPFGAGGKGKKSGDVVGIETFARDILGKSVDSGGAAIAAARETAKNTAKHLTYAERFAKALEDIANHGVAARAVGRT